MSNMKLFRREAADTPASYIASKVRHRVVVHTKAGSSIEGVLVEVYAAEIVLEHASHLSASGRTRIDGEVCIARTNVDWIQRLGPGNAEEA